MRFSVLFLIFALAWQPKTADAGAGSVSLPQPLAYDSDLFDRYWQWAKTELQAPQDLPAPLITVEPLPQAVKMAFYFPTAAYPQERLRIVMSPRALDRAATGERLRVLGELAHEVAHYLLLLSENDWQHRSRAFRNDIHHHCDPTFQRLIRHVGTILWSAYHSNSVVRAIDHMVQRSCWEDGHRIALPN